MNVVRSKDNTFLYTKLKLIYKVFLIVSMYCIQDQNIFQK